ncbi:MAG TPA: 2OG-Fe dioxygenase family protein [Pseudoxanthomonas sp.]|nr:2OG-Fe dioxygenase family protein [Pseudoxanthomonas sp.]
MVATFLPPYIEPAALLPQLAGRGYAVLAPAAVATLCGTEHGALDALESAWEDLQPDLYLKDGGSYRKRRHSCFVSEGGQLTQAAHRAHWQSEEYNALHGGMRRWFEPMQADTIAHPAWTRLLVGLGAICDALKGSQPWYVEAHQFRIDTADGIGRPTPEGAHRDGVDFVAVLLVGRNGISGGETRVFAADGPDGQRFTLTEPWTLMLLDDARVIHESTPIQPLQDYGYRDTLVLTYRAGNFQGDE